MRIYPYNIRNILNTYNRVDYQKNPIHPHTNKGEFSVYLLKKGEHVSLSELPADADATVYARNRDHEVLFQAYVKDGLVEGMDLKVAEMDDWDLRLE